MERELVRAEQFYHPTISDASDEVLLRVHTRRYLDSLSSSLTVAGIVEVPPVALLPSSVVRSHVLNPMRLATAGTLLAAELALRYGWAVNLGGGYHHASSDEGGGFCVFGDISLAIGSLRERHPQLRRFIIVDLDAHQVSSVPLERVVENSVSSSFFFKQVLLLVFSQGNGYERDLRNGIFKRFGASVRVLDAYNAHI